VVVPGARAGRLLLHALLKQAQERSLACEVPVIATLGRFVDSAFAAPAGSKVVANSLERLLAWESVLRRHAADLAQPLVPRGATIDRLVWRRIARSLLRLEDELDGAARTLGEAAEAVTRFGGDGGRLAAVNEMAGEVASLLSEHGLITPHAERLARIAASEPTCDRVVLVGTLELSAIHKLALERLVDVLAIVAGRERTRERFDEYGAATMAWSEAAIDIPSAAIVTAETPRDAAEWALRFIAERHDEDPTLACDDVAIGITDGPGDSEPTRELLVAARDADVDIHDAAGVPLLGTPIGRSVAAAATYRALRQRPVRSIDELATLLRRPAIGRLVGASCGEEDMDPVALVDRVRAKHFASSIDLLPGAPEADRLKTVAAAADAWAERLASGEMEAIGALRAEGPEGGDDEPAIRAFEQLFADALQVAPPLRAESDLLELVLELANGVRLPAEPRERAVEAIGWLELLFEPASHVVVLGMNEGAVPGGSRGDGLLPESVREALGMQTVRRRADRDAALLDLLVHRSRTIRLVVNRRTEQGDPVMPSRLLLRLHGQPLAERVIALASEGNALTGGSLWRRTAGGGRGFTVPQPGEGAREIERISVTDFRAYLASPMRYWLGRIERLEPVDDDPAEIPIPDLGTVVHATLAWFGADPELNLLTDADRVAEAVTAEFDRRALESFGRRPLPAVRLQLEVLRRRLQPWAQSQARSAWDGWVPIGIETPLPDSFVLRPGRGAPVRVVGRIDRIDRNSSTGAIRVIDFKTGDAGRTPRESHREGKKGTGAWCDLQLPLYAAAMRLHYGPEISLETGYVRLPSDPKLSGWIASDFSREELREAFGVALGVIERIRAGEFPDGEPMGAEDPFAGILQCAIFGREDGQSGGDGEGEEP
jgi:ATP-dependent helicase/nuclease subunit B